MSRGHLSVSEDDEEHPHTVAAPHHQRQNNKGHLWTELEHHAFVSGLEKLGRGNWRGISKGFVPSRTPTQVASHAQKYFMRVSGVSKRKSRFGTPELEGAVAPARRNTSSLCGSAGGSPATTATTTSSSGACPSASAPPAALALTGAARPWGLPPVPHTYTTLAAPPPHPVPQPVPAGPNSLGLPVVLPGPGPHSMPMMLAFPPGCSTPVMQPCSMLPPHALALAMSAMFRSGGPGGMMPCCWPPMPLMFPGCPLPGMPSPQLQLQQAAAMQQQAAILASFMRPPSAACGPLLPPPYNIPPTVRKPEASVPSAATGGMRALLGALDAACGEGRAGAAVSASLHSAFRPVARA